MAKRKAPRKKKTPAARLLLATLGLAFALALLAVAFLATQNIVFLYAAVALVAIAVIPLVTALRDMSPDNGD